MKIPTKTDPVTLRTERLSLRPWRQSDFQPFAVLNADPQVMNFFPSILNTRDSDTLALRLAEFITENGWGFWAIETSQTGEFIGFTGLSPAIGYPFPDSIEIGWRLAKKFWGRGYATEAANAVLQFAFRQLRMQEVVSFTAVENKRSQAVMRGIGLNNTDENFHHPKLAKSSPLSEHVLYKIDADEYRIFSEKENNS